MPFNGSGVFQRVYNWVSDKNSSIDITASRFDTEDDGFASGLSSCVLKDGTQTITANLPMAGFKFTGLGAGTSNADSATVGQVQNSTVNWVVSAGTADAITANYSPSVASLVDGMELDFRATGANTTTTPTFAPSGLTAHTITQNGGSALVVGNIPAANFEAKLRYNLANTRWELLNPIATIGTNVITNSNLAQMAANTIKSNITGSTANATDSTLTAIIDADIGSTQGNILYRGASSWSVLAPGTLGKTLISGGASANPSYTGPNSAQSTPSNPTGTTNTSGLMMGLAGSITPVGSGIILVNICGDMTNSTTNDGASIQLRYGTGTAPSNAGALTGTTIGNSITATAATGSYNYPFCVSVIISGLSASTAYWLDLSLAAITGGTASISNITINSHELK